MNKTITIGIGIAALSSLLVLGLTQRGESQGTPSSITVGIYAPTVDFGGSAGRSAYVKSLANSIKQNTGVANVQALSFTSMGQLTGKKVDFAIIDGLCYAAKPKGKLLANAKVGGGTTRQWALYSSQGPSLSGLQNKKLSYVKTGCNDTGFLENAMLESEVSSSYFAGRVGKPDVPAAVAEVVSRKGAQGVFAPSGSQKGLTKVFDAGSVPNPAFVQLNTKLPSSLSSKVSQAVRSFGGGGAISGWSSPDMGKYRSLRSRLGRRVKRGLMSSPSPVRVDAKDVLNTPKSLDDWDTTPVGQHFEAPPERI